MENNKKSLEETTKDHKVSFKKEPIWIRANFIGKYDGINFRFTYREYFNAEVEEIVKNLIFAWPGRIPEDKKFAEEGITALFLKRREDDTLDYKVTEDEAERVAIEVEEELFDDYVNNLEGDEDIQEGL